MLEDDKGKYMAKIEVTGPSVEVLKVTIDEQRRVYDELVDSKKHLDIKTLTLTGAGLALLTYLYASGNLFVPEQLYGQILYVIGAVLAFGAVGTLLYAVKPSGQWQFPTETDEKLVDLAEADEQAYLVYVKNRYIYCYKNNIKYYSKKQRLMNLSFFPLVFGGIILVAIKVLEGTL